MRHDDAWSEYQPSNYFALGLKFHSIEVHGSEVPLTLSLIDLETENLVRVHRRQRIFAVFQNLVHLDLVQVLIEAVSYTHLDVYKRQAILLN